MSPKMKYFFISFLTLTCFFAFQNCGPQKKSNSQNHSLSQIDTTDDRSSENELLSTQEVLDRANFSWIDQNIIIPECLACHSDKLSFRDLNFSTYSGVMKVVTPRSPEKSLFYTRSFSTIFFKLTPSEQQIIRAWILDGAKKD